MNKQRQNIHFPRFLSGLLLAILLTQFCGCIFNPRDPEPPTSGQSIAYLERNSPRKVWENLQISLNASDSFGWENNLHEEFTYEPDSEAENDFPGVFEGWDQSRELNFINNFYASGVKNVAKMRDDNFIVPDPVGDEAIWESVIYYVKVVDLDNESETRYRASATITFRSVGNFWYVYKWVDLIGENDPETEQSLPTMGVLRGTFGSN